MRIFLIILCSTIVLSCNNQKFIYSENISVKQLPMDYPVTLRADPTNDRVAKVHFRIPFKIINKSPAMRYLIDIDYYLNRNYGKYYLSKYSDGWTSCLIYNEVNNEIDTATGRLKDKRLNNNHPLYIYIPISHDIDTTEHAQLQLKQYLEKMKMQHTDTLSVPFNEFKKMHGQLITNLLKGDSISLFIKKDINKYDELADTIMNIPIRY